MAILCNSNRGNVDKPWDFTFLICWNLAGLRFFHWLYHRIISPDRVDRLQIELEEAKDERQGSAGSSVSVYEKDNGKFHNFLPPDPDPDPCGPPPPPHHHHHDDHRHPSIFMNTRHCFQQEIHISMQRFEGGTGPPPGFFFRMLVVSYHFSCTI